MDHCVADGTFSPSPLLSPASDACEHHLCRGSDVGTARTLSSLTAAKLAAWAGAIQAANA
ncbi:hypothetical protein I552_6225 [Mycobacterium xenopi 3993]|nr:hypothetical protein I552_6225 [Mycobacterium xenopi 3993]